MKKINIAIVGGGPVGLTTAISLIYDQGWNEQPNEYLITVYEKRKKYTREQFIITGGTKGDLLRNYPNKLTNILVDNFSCYIDNPIYDMSGFCFKVLEKGMDFKDFSKTIEINKMEKILSNYIKNNYKKQIKIIYKEFTERDMSNYDIIIGADGSESYVRTKLMKVKWENIKDYESHILHIKYTDLSNKKYQIKNRLLPLKLQQDYEIKLKRKHLDEKKKEKKSFKQDRFRLIRSDTNKTQFLLQIKKSTYNKIKKIKLFGKLPEKVKNSVLIDMYFMGSLPKNLNKTKISVYDAKVGHSATHAMLKKDKLCVLIGDSSRIVHVFTGEGLNINFGILNSLIEDYKNNNVNAQRVVFYNRMRHKEFERNVKYKAFLRHVPHKLIKKICQRVKIKDVIQLLHNELKLWEYHSLITGLRGKYKNITENEIRDELCLIFRDKILKYFSYKLKL